MALSLARHLRLKWYAVDDVVVWCVVRDVMCVAIIKINLSYLLEIFLLSRENLSSASSFNPVFNIFSIFIILINRQGAMGKFFAFLAPF
jgi:hypothetical protein